MRTDGNRVPALLACDWGTTNLRALLLDAKGGLLEGREFPGLGAASLSDGEARRRFADLVRPALGAESLPAMLCGMAGSDLGWAAAPYVDCPADLEALAGHVMRVEGEPGPVLIAPGVRWTGFNGRGDVMRGEETQVMGWLGADPSRAAGSRLICHPGTHAKWIKVEDGRIAAFVTSMTGELFAVLRRYSVLKTAGETETDVDLMAFDEGVDAAGDGSALAARLFTARARIVGFGAPTTSAGSYLSGLLIGAEAASAPRLLGVSDRRPVDLIGEPTLCRLYGRALAANGVAHLVHDAQDAAVAGLFALWTCVAERFQPQAKAAP